jgi:hypothetical protein
VLDPVICHYPGWGTQRINTAYVYGGPALVIRTIQFVGVDLDHYMVASMPSGLSPTPRGVYVDSTAQTTARYSSARLPTRRIRRSRLRALDTIRTTIRADDVAADRLQSGNKRWVETTRYQPITAPSTTSTDLIQRDLRLAYWSVNGRCKAESGDAQ